MPDRDAVRPLVDLGGNFTADDGSGYSFGLWADTFTGSASGQIGRPVPADSSSPPSAASGPTPEAANSPYLYALAEAVPGRMPTGFVRDYRRRDLATVVHQFARAAPGHCWPSGRVSADLGVQHRRLGLVLPTVVPGQRVEYYNTNGRALGLLQVDFGTPDEDRPGWTSEAALFSEHDRSTGPAGSTATGGTTRRTEPVLPEAALAEPAGQSGSATSILVDVPIFSDAAGHPGGSLTDTARTALYRDGVLVGESADTPATASSRCRPGRPDYRLVTSATRSFTDLSTEVGTAWTFRSGTSPVTTPVPLPAIGGALRADAATCDNSAPAGRAFELPVRVQRQPGAPAARRSETLTVEVSYDGGKSWSKAKCPHRRPRAGRRSCGTRRGAGLRVAAGHRHRHAPATRSPSGSSRRTGCAEAYPARVRGRAPRAPAGTAFSRWRAARRSARCPVPVRGRASSAPVTELRQNSRPSTPDSSRRLDHPAVRQGDLRARR